MTISVEKNLEISSEEDFRNPRIVFSLLKYLEETRHETDFGDYYAFVVNSIGFFEFVVFLIDKNILKDVENLANIVYTQSSDCKILHFLDKIRFDGYYLKSINKVLISLYISQNDFYRVWLFKKFTEIKKYYGCSYTFSHTPPKEITEAEWKEIKKFKVYDSKYRGNKRVFKLI